MLRDIDARVALENSSGLVGQSLRQRVMQMLSELRRVAIDVGEEEVADKALPKHCSGQKSAFHKEGPITIPRDRGVRRCVERGDVG